jgi:ATP adenylyltransferase
LAGFGGFRGRGCTVSGVPDELERLWTPHRLAYVAGAASDQPTGCPFCLAPTRSDEDGLVVARGDVVYAVLNLYPYNPGHLMVCPYRHIADYTELTPAETLELAQFTQTAMTVIRRVSGPAGFNLGMNQGHVAGAGIAAHLHQHVVPRWSGDTNFMPVIGRTKTLPQLLGDTRRLLAEAWAEHVAPKRVARKRAPAKASTGTAAGTAQRTPAKRTPTKRVPAKR